MAHREEEKALVLKREEKEKFKTTVFSMVGVFRFDITHAITSKDTLEKLIRKVEKNSRYEKEMPQETAILYRLYGASILFSVKGVNAALNTYIERAYPYIEKSFNLDPKVWEKSHEKSSYEFMKRAAINKKESLPVEEWLFSQFTIAMVMADEAEVRNTMKPYWEKMMELVQPSGPKTDYEYFRDFRQKGFKGLSYGQLISTLEIMITGQGGKFDGPYYLPTESGKTLIRYIVSPVNKPQQYLEWIVDKDQNLIEPQTVLAKDLHSIIMKGREDTPRNP